MKPVKREDELFKDVSVQVGSIPRLKFPSNGKTLDKRKSTIVSSVEQAETLIKK